MVYKVENGNGMQPEGIDQPKMSDGIIYRLDFIE